MSERDPGLEAFSKFIVALEPWLGEVVLVGGWAHRLYRLDPRARKLEEFWLFEHQRQKFDATLHDIDQERPRKNFLDGRLAPTS